MPLSQQNEKTNSFLFYDLETFGMNPAKTRIAQFAAIRTDIHLNIIEEPISFFIQPADDMLPSPIATLITGITPQYALKNGINEADAFKKIMAEMSRPNTCTLGYNSLRFDDEFIRYGLYRNYYDPYEREYRNGNSRWDLLDVMRLARALRPDGIHWVNNEKNTPSFKLEHLAIANAVRQGDAHEALSDVYATIGMAQKFKQAQPKLWDFALTLRDKNTVDNLLDTINNTPVLHISQRYSAERLCAAPVLPLIRHPQYNNRIIVFDLDQAPDDLLNLSVDEILYLLYTPAAALPEGKTRIGLKEVHLNKSPIIIPWKYLRQNDFERLNISPDKVMEYKAQIAQKIHQVSEKIRHVFSQSGNFPIPDADAAIYSAFLNNNDKKMCTQLRNQAPEKITEEYFYFQDHRLNDLLLRYRARNYPHLLSTIEKQRWNNYRKLRLLENTDLSEYTLASYFAEIEQCRQNETTDAKQHQLLDQLVEWGMNLQKGLE